MGRRLALAALVALAACSSGPPAPKAGFVIGREYHEARTETIMMCASYGKYGCAVWMPLTEHHDASWHLKLRNEGHEGWRTVPEATYDRCADNEWCVTDG